MNKSDRQNFANTCKGKHGIQRLINALCYSYDGIKSACDEAGFRELLAIHSLLMVILYFIDFSLPIKMILIIASFFSLIVELFNTAVEAAVDHTSMEKHPLAKRAKDVASAAQYLSLIMLAILWLMAIFH